MPKLEEDKGIFKKTLDWVCNEREFVAKIEEFFDDNCEMFREALEITGEFTALHYTVI